jgi:hypothetical protein
MKRDIKEEIIKIAQRCGLNRDDLIIEAETVEECGEYLHMSLLGYSPEDLRSAASELPDDGLKDEVEEELEAEEAELEPEI